MDSLFSRRLFMVLCAVLLAGGALMIFPHISAAAPVAAPSADAYVVKAGDTLNAIAARYGVSTSALARANGIVNINRIYVGQRLVIPGRSGSTAPATGGAAAPATGGVYIVQRGDTLSRIAARYGTTVQSLMALNNIANPNRIWVGQRLAIAKGAAGGAPAAKPPTSTGSASERWIDINLSQQRLTAYQGNTPVFSTLISGGLPRTPTVVGRFRIQTKLTSTRMTGPGYDLPGVPYTMYFYKGYAIHGTYWHNNFGRPMSHGCVNMRTPDAAWLFNWASIGTLVVTHY
ncbi:MAG: N-acetylmuramoyl-L-alanine amidase sle1 precursor [Chloroflexi bacterium ADurb.Bin325]|nr:MAG: N-acetylmuramoyl-L-alanine amidase sle1 precursor [Chloroflexi bacterium ADurb.Bin325]